jgi:signal transduction histidine kinase
MAVFMEQSTTILRPEIYGNLCALSHDLNNGLGIIAGHCELLAEQADPNSELARRLQVIREVAFSLAKKINGHDCRMATRDARGPHSFVSGEKHHMAAR